MILLTAVCLAAAAGLILSPRLPLGSTYHVFADTRRIFGLPNAWDVLSNIPFFLVGLWGLIEMTARSNPLCFIDGKERIPYLVFFTGVMLTGAGSFWYHLEPSDSRLPWDLLPMTCSFAALVVATYMERVNVRTGFLALVPMLLLAMSTVVYWYVTAAAGRGDYKFYLFLQFFSPVVLALLIGLFPARYTGFRFLAIAFGCYVVAKLFEEYDIAIYRDLGGRVSGHALKHLTAAVACYWILEMLRRRHPALAEPARGFPASVFVKSDESAATK